MLAPRRFLPSTDRLRSFEATARAQSFTLAARELSLTQSAVSRHVRALEEQLGTKLLLRNNRKVCLTAAGEAYVRHVREALRIIASASIGLESNPHGGPLDLAILPTFGARWLAPRLAGFLDQNHGVTVNLSTRLQPFDFAFERFDAAIHFGQPDWPGTRAAFLMREMVLPACAPGFLDRHRLVSASDLRTTPLIHLSSRPGAWAHWFKAHGVAGEDLTGMTLDQFATAAQAAKHGLGVALLPAFLIERELADGGLVAAMDLPLKAREAYYLVWPEHRSSYPPLVAFKNWITGATLEADA